MQLYISDVETHIACHMRSTQQLTVQVVTPGVVGAQYAAPGNDTAAKRQTLIGFLLLRYRTQLSAPMTADVIKCPQ